MSNCLISYCGRVTEKNYCPKHEKLPIRSQIVAPKDKVLLQVDLSQAEAWIVAFMANESKMKQALQFGDIHCLSAAMFAEGRLGDWKIYLTSTDKSAIPTDERYLAKRINHGGNYGMTYIKGAEVINKDSDKPPYVSVTNKQMKKKWDMWLSFYRLQAYWDNVDMMVKTDHFLITPYGRKRNCYGMNPKDYYAHIPQSTVADHCFGKVQKELGIEGGLYTIYDKICEPSKGEIKIINTSHDSGILELPQTLLSTVAPEAISYMRRPLVINGEQFTIPVDAEVGDRWGELEKYKVAA